MTAPEPQTHDATQQTDLDVLGLAPAFAMSMIYLSMADSMGKMFENAVTVQQNQNTQAITAAATGVQLMQKMDTIADALAILEAAKKTAAS